MTFKKFTLKNIRSAKPTIAIWKSGAINFNKAAIQKYNIADFNYIVLYFDEEDNRIGFELFKEPVDNGMKISSTKSYAKILSQNFLHANNIKHKKAKVFESYLDKDTNLIVINL